MSTALHKETNDQMGILPNDRTVSHYTSVQRAFFSSGKLWFIKLHFLFEIVFLLSFTEEDIFEPIFLLEYNRCSFKNILKNSLSFCNNMAILVNFFLKTRYLLPFSQNPTRVLPECSSSWSCRATSSSTGSFACFTSGMSFLRAVLCLLVSIS